MDNSSLLLGKLASEISDISGFSITASDLHPGMNNKYSFRIVEYPEPIGFFISVERSPLSWRIETKLDAFPGKLLEIFSENLKLHRKEFDQIIHDISLVSSKINFNINEKPYFEFDDSGIWDSFLLEIDVPIFEDRKLEFSDNDELIFSLTQAVNLALIPFLLLSGDNDSSSTEQNFDLEGEVSKGSFNRYERSRRNRNLCLLHFGYRCQACNILLEEKYGQAGKDFVHVHHSVPVSMMANPAEVNPYTDLVPLCPNCHYISHRSSPPLSLSELIGIIN